MGATEIMILRRYGGQSGGVEELKLRILRSFKNLAVRLLALKLRLGWQTDGRLPFFFQHNDAFDRHMI